MSLRWASCKLICPSSNPEGELRVETNWMRGVQRLCNVNSSDHLCRQSHGSRLYLDIDGGVRLDFGRTKHRHTLGLPSNFA